MDQTVLPAVLVIAQSGVIANRLRRLLERVFTAHYAAESAVKADRLLAAHSYDVVVLADPLKQQPSVLPLIYLHQQSAALVVFDSQAETNARAIALALAEARLGMNSLLPLPCPHKRLREAIDRLPNVHGKTSLQLAPRSVDEIRLGIDEGRIVPWYQPKVSTATGHVVGFEALARWIEPDGQVIPPAMFISVAEQHELIQDLTRSFILAAINEAARWQRMGYYWHVSVNTTVDDLEGDDFVEWLTDNAERCGVLPEKIIIEVTESRVSRNFAALLFNLTRLHELGFGISIDDFGTGFSSLQQLNRMPFTELKIDQSFVTSAHSDKEKRVILDSSVSIGHGLDLFVIAEGVETDEDWWQACQSGVDACQGYFIGKPMPPSSIEDWLAGWRIRAQLITQKPPSRFGLLLRKSLNRPISELPLWMIASAMILSAAAGAGAVLTLR